MSDEVDPPPLRLKPRSRPDAPADASPPAAPTDSPAPVAADDASAPSLKLRAKPKLSLATDEAKSPAAEPAPAAVPPQADPVPAPDTDPRSPVPPRAKPRLAVAMEPDPLPSAPPDPGPEAPAVAPSPMPPPVAAEPDPADGAGAPAGGPRFKLKPKTAATAPAPKAPPPASAPELPPAVAPTPIPAPTPEDKLPGEDSTEVLRPKVPDLAAPESAEKDLTQVAATLPPPPGFKGKGMPRRRRRGTKLSVALTLLGVLLVLVGGMAGVYWVFVKSTPDQGPPPPPPVSASAAPTGATSLPGKMVEAAQQAVAAHESLGEESVDGMLAARGEESPPAESWDVRTAPPPPVEPSALKPDARPAPAPEAIPPGAEFQVWVSEAKISGVFQGNPARALINGRTVREGELLDAVQGIVFEGVNAEEKIVIFRDASGALVGKKY